MIKQHTILLFIGFVVWGCENNVCIDESKISNDPCYEIYAPVCGCDGITYDNYCVADSSGVASYVAGECCD